MKKLKKGTRYLILLGITILLMELSGIIFIAICYFPVSKVTGMDYKTYYNSLALLSSYNDNNIIPALGITAYEYFENNPGLLDNATFIYCLVQFLSYIPIIVVAVIFLGRDLIDDLKRFGKSIKRNIVVILLCYAALIYLNNIVNMIYGLLGDTGESANEGLINLLLTSNGKWFMIISVVLIAPLTEEIIFRKLLIDTCELKFKFKPWLAILVSALVFSFIHVSDLASIKYIFQYLALAVPICCAYHFSENNIVTSFTMHLINNLLSVIVTFASGAIIFR